MNLLNKIEELKNSSIKKQIDERINEFCKIGRKNNNEIFKELCFCILTANSTAERCIDVQKKVGNDFLNLSSAQLQKKLKQHGCRFHTKRAGYIIEARKYKDELREKSREWLAENIKGIGYKEASHFLRNIGFDNYAIIDFHIVDILEKNKLIQKSKTITRGKYLEIEEVLRKLANKTKLTLSELDLYLWYLETGKVLK